MPRPSLAGLALLPLTGLARPSLAGLTQPSLPPPAAAPPCARQLARELQDGGVRLSRTSNYGMAYNVPDPSTAFGTSRPYTQHGRYGDSYFKWVAGWLALAGREGRPAGAPHR